MYEIKILEPFLDPFENTYAENKIRNVFLHYVYQEQCDFGDRDSMKSFAKCNKALTSRKMYDFQYYEAVSKQY